MGHNPETVLKRLEGRIPLVHIKDVANRRPVELGNGDVDVEAAARDTGAEWLIYKHASRVISPRGQRCSPRITG